MKFLQLTFIITLSLLSGFALAQEDHGVDGIGLYADAGAMTNYQNAQAGEIIDLYLMATNIAGSDGVNAFELSINCSEPHVEMVDLVIEGVHASVGIFPSITVGLQQPTPYGPIIQLAIVSFLVTETLPANLYIGPAGLPEGGSMGNSLPVYIAGMDNDNMMNLYPSSGSINNPVFRINGLGPVAITNSTLDGVKALYR